jgi:hypothetical protein
MIGTGIEPGKRDGEGGFLWLTCTKGRGLIGIGGAVTRSPLPHHLTCGSASGGSEGYAGRSSKEGSPSEAK